MQSNQTANRLLRLPSVSAQTGLSKSEIYRRIKSGTFPQPLKLGARAVAWQASAVDDWAASLQKREG
ncbi:helix-turn-helix transcriptional regulator [Pseudoduganella danionis]|uniref:AlpA family phage regulatory protein n=1 Tax=Pseudoduganella danionis TaxID=1890295 RepID=A0ABW9SMQ8_9BURK|nr:AlpA family transcriptional regulator [Pseudoduganella danionis]MTW33467.1 AlpA family phage regulatory protein [Pseudoduganella danionis]